MNQRFRWAAKPSIARCEVENVGQALVELVDPTIADAIDVRLRDGVPLCGQDHLLEPICLAEQVRERAPENGRRLARGIHLGREHGSELGELASHSRDLFLTFLGVETGFGPRRFDVADDVVVQNRPLLRETLEARVEETKHGPEERPGE